MISAIALSMALAMAEKETGRRTRDPAPVAAVGSPPAAEEPPPAPPPPTVFVKGTPPRRGNLASVFSADDYPPAARRAHDEGIVEFLLVIGPEGRVNHCAIERSSGSMSLDTATCRLLYRRGRFEPGRDLQGEPLTGMFRSKASWRITSILERRWAPTLYVEEMLSAADGEYICREGWDGEAPMEEICERPEASRLVGRAYAARKALERSIVTKLTPEGMSEAADRADRGDLFWEADAIFTIGADGKLLECRTLRSHYLGRDRPTGAPPSPCRGWGVGKSLYAPAAEGSGTRTVNVRVRGYVGAARGSGDPEAWKSP